MKKTLISIAALGLSCAMMAGCTSAARTRNTYYRGVRRAETAISEMTPHHTTRHRAVGRTPNRGVVRDVPRFGVGHGTVPPVRRAIETTDRTADNAIHRNDRIARDNRNRRVHTRPHTRTNTAPAVTAR